MVWVIVIALCDVSVFTFGGWQSSNLRARQQVQ